MLIDREELCGLVPHSGSMCLLDSVLSWDQTHIRCTASSHTDPGNPLRKQGRLAAVHLLEYGAQAMAVHGGILARETSSVALPGYLASLRDVTMIENHIDQIITPLEIDAEKIAASSDSYMYKFRVTTNGQFLASARATVIAVSRIST